MAILSALKLCHWIQVFGFSATTNLLQKQGLPASIPHSCGFSEHFFGAIKEDGREGGQDWHANYEEDGEPEGAISACLALTTHSVVFVEGVIVDFGVSLDNVQRAHVTLAALAAADPEVASAGVSVIQTALNFTLIKAECALITRCLVLSEHLSASISSHGQTIVVDAEPSHRQRGRSVDRNTLLRHL